MALKRYRGWKSERVKFLTWNFFQLLKMISWHDVTCIDQIVDWLWFALCSLEGETKYKWIIKKDESFCKFCFFTHSLDHKQRAKGRTRGEERTRRRGVNEDTFSRWKWLVRCLFIFQGAFQVFCIMCAGNKNLFFRNFSREIVHLTDCYDDSTQVKLSLNGYLLENHLDLFKSSYVAANAIYLFPTKTKYTCLEEKVRDERFVVDLVSNLARIELKCWRDASMFMCNEWLMGHRVVHFVSSWPVRWVDGM